MFAIVTVVQEDDTDPLALYFEAETQEALDELLDQFYTALHSDPTQQFIATTHSGLKPVRTTEEALIAGTEFHLDIGVD